MSEFFVLISNSRFEIQDSINKTQDSIIKLDIASVQNTEQNTRMNLVVVPQRAPESFPFTYPGLQPKDKGLGREHLDFWDVNCNFCCSGGFIHLWKK